MLTKDLSITFCGVKFPNPFCLSSSPVGNCYEMCAKAYDTGWGGVVFKTIGFFIANEVSPRFDHLVKEDTGFIGFKNMEQIAEHPLEENLAALRQLKEDYPDKVLIASSMGENEQQWEELARLVQEAGADMIECNFSCPQMTSHAMGSDVGQSPELVEKYCRAVKRGSTLPMLAKMTPNIGDMCEVALAAKRGGADGIAAINTVKSITNIDLNQKIGMPIVNGKSSISGYSGKAVKPIALRFIQQMRTHPELRDFPISGIGGIETWEDAAEFLLLGAATLQVYRYLQRRAACGLEQLDNRRSAVCWWFCGDDRRSYDCRLLFPGNRADRYCCRRVRRSGEKHSTRGTSGVLANPVVLCVRDPDYQPDYSVHRSEPAA